MRRRTILMILMTAVILAGCRNIYYGTMEKLGYQKRDLLVDRVEGARDAQQEAKQQFASALEQFSALVGYQGGDLEKIYNRLKAEYDRSEGKAQAVHKRIHDVQVVADALFDEWKAELRQYTNKSLRALSQQKLKETQERYTRLIEAMQRAENSMAPVLAAFRDQVLFLKHNLNARAVASLQDELASVEKEVTGLVKEMEASITEANTFIEAMSREQEVR